MSDRNMFSVKYGQNNQLDEALSDPSSEVRAAAVRQLHVTKKHLDEALSDPHWLVRTEVAFHPSATKEHLDRALEDTDFFVRAATARHPSTSKEQLERLSGDTHYSVRNTAKHRLITKNYGGQENTKLSQITEASISHIMMNESILLEDRLQFLKDNTGKLSTDHDTTGKYKETPDIVQHFADHGDPTKNKSYTQYAISLYKNKTIRQEDAPRLHAALANFDKYKGKLPAEDRSINAKKYPSISSIEDKVAPHVGTLASKKEGEKTLDQPGHKLVYEDDKIKIYHLSSAEASQNLYGGGYQRGGTGTSWCTAVRSGNNMFDRYNKQGKIHVVHRKSDGAVFQYHPNSDQFMDAKDNEISHADFKSISEPLHKAWKKNPSLVE